MGFFQGRTNFQKIPGADDMGNRYRQYGQGQTLGMGGKIAKQGLKQMSLGGGAGGYDTGIVGNLLAPLRDQYSTMQRDVGRGYGLGSMGLTGASNPAQVARLQQLAQDKVGESMGHAYAEAVPNIFGQLSNTFQNAQDSRRRAEEFGLQGEQSTLGMGQWRQEPSFLDKLGQIGGLASQFAGMAFGLPGLGGGAPQLPQGQTSTMGLWRANPSRF